MSIFGNRTPEIIKNWNENTWLVKDREAFYVCKSVMPDDLNLYKKLTEVKSPYIAKVFDVCVVNDHLCAVQEYVRGQTLENYLREHGDMDQATVRHIALQLCEGLGALHEKGIVHRDLTPNNIIVTDRQKVKIIDFGISRVERVNASNDTEFLGTAGFAAPEQYGFRQSSARTDIYALGVLINYMLVGTFPNEQLANGQLRSIIVKCTKMDEADRYQTTKELADTLKMWGKDPNALQSNIPGFRHNVWWHKIVAFFYYVTTGMLTVSGAFITEYGMHGRILAPIIFTLFFLLPVPIIFNGWNWLDRFAPTSGKGKMTCRFWQMLALFACFAIGVLLVAIV